MTEMFGVLKISPNIERQLELNLYLLKRPKQLNLDSSNRREQGGDCMRVLKCVKGINKEYIQKIVTQKINISSHIDIQMREITG